MVCMENIEEIAEKHGFARHKGYGSNPRVYLFGFTHPGNEIAQQDGLHGILQEGTKPGDMVLMEGFTRFTTPFEVDWDGYHANDLIGRLKEVFIERGVRVIYNDRSGLCGEYLATASQLQYRERQGMRDAEFARLSARLPKIGRERERNFCLHKSSGIVPLVKGTAKILKQPSPDARFFQLTGIAHVKSGVMDDLLQQHDVPYISFLPRE